MFILIFKKIVIDYQEEWVRRTNSLNALQAAFDVYLLNTI